MNPGVCRAHSQCRQLLNLLRRVLVHNAGDRQRNVQLVGALHRCRTTYADLLHSQLLNEIMPMIYKRFTEKAAEEWRQIYKVRSFPSFSHSR